MTQRIGCADGAHREQAVTAALAAVRRGDVVLLPTETVYALATDAFSARGVRAVRDAKGYEADAPLPVMVGSRTTVPGIAARVGDDALALMDAFWPGPLTLLLQPQPTLAWDLPPDAPLAVRMPLHPVAVALLSRSGPLVVTAANLPGLPPPSTVDDALLQLGDVPVLALDAGDLTAGDLAAGESAEDAAVLSTIVDVTGAVPRVVRWGAVDAARLARVCPLADLGPGTARA